MAISEVTGRFESLRDLTQGSYGSVYLARDKRTDEEVVIKKIRKKAEGYTRIRNEIKANMILKERDVDTCGFHGFFSSHLDTHLVFDYITGMDLYYVMHSRGFKPLPELAVRHILRCVAQTLSTCHRAGIAHRDVKLENIMVTPEHDDRVYLIDFGLCSFFDKDAEEEAFSRDYSGSSHYMSPEVIRHIPLRGTLADAWSLGVTAYALIFGSFPYGVRDAEQIFKGSESIPLPKDAGEVTLSPHMRHKLSRLLTVDPDRRASVEILL
ncbi:putative serine/threonine protein kinase [Planoprotostelium fungivorum]|uniref:Putative serine/threonine protein kinase n=1 Tax=Planoprotostelium fungivorum TaxID=1890364 RepID=A0A2P6NJK9_9EUKA|nr:putative serine/threonine protein kinase [Planoprotostelium fungivorum]